MLNYVFGCAPVQNTAKKHVPLKNYAWNLYVDSRGMF